MAYLCQFLLTPNFSSVQHSLNVLLESINLIKLNMLCWHIQHKLSFICFTINVLSLRLPGIAKCRYTTTVLATYLSRSCMKLVQLMVVEFESLKGETFGIFADLQEIHEKVLIQKFLPIIVNGCSAQVRLRFKNIPCYCCIIMLHSVTSQ